MVYVFGFIVVVALFFFISSFFNGFKEFYRKAEHTQGEIIIGRSDVRLIRFSHLGKEYTFICPQGQKMPGGEIVKVYYDPDKLDSPVANFQFVFTLESEKQYQQSIKKTRYSLAVICLLSAVFLGLTI